MAKGSGGWPAWTEISTDFDPEEETANFGTRHALEADGNIYEVVTLSTIEPVEEATSSHLRILSSSSTNIMVTIDSTLIIFSADCQEAQSLVFSSRLDCVCVSPCGNFLIAGTSQGGMEFLHIPSRTVLATIPLTNSIEGQNRTFVSAAILGTGEDTRMFLVSKDKVFVFCDLDLDFLHSSILKADFAALKTAQSKLEKNEFSLDNLELTRALIYSHHITGDTVMLAVHSDGLSLCNLHNDRVSVRCELLAEAFGDVNILHMQMDKGKRRLYALDSAGCIHVVCLRILCVIQILDEVRVKEMQLLEEEADQEFRFLLITKDSSGDLFLEIRSSNSFQLTYRLKVAELCVPVAAELSVETPMVIEGTADDVLKPDVINKLRLRGVTEGIPEVRLERILRRGRFDEAETFATTFKLNKDTVYKRKIAWTMEQLSPWNSALSHQEKEDLFRQLKLDLDKVTDTEFVIECCSMAALPTIQMSKDILIYARTKIGERSEELSSDHMMRIGKTMHRLQTFIISGHGGDVEEWLKFMRTDMMVALEDSLADGQISRSLLYWVRHKAELQTRMDPDQVEVLLDSIPHTTSLSLQLQWYRQFLPDVLQFLPASLPLIADWSAATVRRLELDRREWPENGLTFAEDILATLQFCRSGEDFNQFMTILTLNQQRTQADSALAQFIQLINLLKDLLLLKQRFRIKLKLAEIKDENKMNVVTLILDWVMAAEEIPALLDNFLISYIQRHHLELNKTLMDYILSLLHNTNYTWHWHVGSAPWEEKVACLLPYITSVEDRSTVILECVKQAPVPWSSTISDICELGVNLQHPNSVKIVEQRSLVSVKAIFRKYECKNFLSSGREAERQLQLIMLKGGEEGYKDVLTVAEVMGTMDPLSVKKMYIHHLIDDRLDSTAAFRMISESSAHSEVAADICEDIVNKAGLAFQLEVGEKVEEVYAQVLKRIITNYRSSTDSRELELVTTAQLLVNAVSLKNEFNLRTKETDWLAEAGSLRDLGHCRDLLVKHIGDKVPQASDGEGTMINRDGAETEEAKHTDFSSRTELERVLRICDLTGLQHEEGVGRFILELNKKGWYEDSLTVADILKNCPLDQTLANIIFSVVYNTEGVASRGGGEVGDLPDILADLAANSLVHCQESALIDTLELFNWQSISSRIHLESHDRRAYSAASAAAALDVYDTWRFNNAYRDKGLPLDREDILPFAFHSLEAVLPLVEDPPLSYLPRNHSCTVEVTDLDVTCPDLESEGNGVDAQEVCLDLVTQANSLVTGLQAAGHAQLALQALERAEGCLSSILLGTNPDFAANLETRCVQTRGSLLAQLIPRILAESRWDPELGLGLLLLQNTKVSLNLLATINSGFGQDYRKISGLAVVGYQYCKLLNLGKQAEQFLDLYVRSCWGRQTSSLAISFKAAFSGSVKEKIAALEKLVVHPSVDVNLLLLYATAFNIKEDETLVLYSSALIRRMEPRVDEKGDIEISDNREIQEKICQALSMLSSPQILFEHLFNELCKVNPYNYEGLEFILQQIHTHQRKVPEFVEKASTILGFLIQYKRVGEAQPEAEVDAWLKERGTPFPILASKRLPLYSLITLPNKEKCKLLEKEFSLDTYKSWLLVCGSLGISVDTICMFVVTNTITNMMDKNSRGKTGRDQWLISHNNKTLLEELMNCILEMKNPEKASAASNWIVNRLPRGADKVMAAAGYLRIATGWRDKDPANKNTQVGFNIAQKTKDQLETEQVLFKHDLAQECYLELVDQHKPLDLITRLYEDPSIIHRNKIAAGNYPDIQAAADEIARLNRLNHTQIKYDLLDRWLPLSAAANINETLSDFSLDLNSGSSSDCEDADTENLLRCVYLLQDRAEDGIRYLLKFSMSTDPLVSTFHRLRALKCLFSIAGREELESFTGKTVDQLTSLIKQLVFRARMEKLNLPFNVESFQQSAEGTSNSGNVSSLVEGIWRSCKHTVEGVVLVRDLCSEFGIWKPNIWSAILVQINKYGVIRELERTLLLLSGEPQLWSCPQLLQSWNTLLAAPFSTAASPPTDEDEERIRSTLMLVHSCPTAMDLDLDPLVEECFRTGLAHLTIIIAPYLDLAARTSVRERVLNQVSREELTDKLARLEKQGVHLPTGFLKLPPPSAVETSGAL